MLQVIGKLQQHRIENRGPRTNLQAPKPLIEEIDSSIKDSNRTKAQSDRSLGKVSVDPVINSKSNYVLLKQPSEGAAKHLIGLFRMPKGVR